MRGLAEQVVLDRGMAIIRCISPFEDMFCIVRTDLCFGDVAPRSKISALIKQEAVERSQRRQQHRSAVDRILANRVNAPHITEAEFRAAREDGRP